jgi:hypothetical protein
VLKGVDIDTDGIGVLVRYLRKVEPDLAKQLPKEMRHVAKPIVTRARELVPQPTALTNWGKWTLARSSGGDRAWTKKATTGIVAQTDVRALGPQGQINLLSIAQKDPAGAIYENAGRRREGDIHSKNAGDRFVAALNAKSTAPRTLWPAVEENLFYLNRELQDVIDRWSAELEKTLDRAA